MAISNSVKTALTKSNKAAQSAALGSIIQGLQGGVYTAVAADATANYTDILTRLTTATNFIVQVYRANVNVTGDAVITLTGETLRVADGATYVLTAGDVIHWMVS